MRIFFVGAGEKNLSLQYVQPIKVPSDEAAHPVLDNLKIKKSTAGIKYQSLAQSIEFFLEAFPGGLYGDKFNRHEREYKDQAHVLGQTLLGQKAFSTLLEAHEYAEIGKRALKSANATNLIFPNENMALKDGLATEGAPRAFATSLYQLLHGEGALDERFLAFADVLEELGAAKWTTATYFIFICKPAEYMFVKPTITQYAAELCGFEINYKPQLNWLTYKSVLEFSKYLFSEIAALKPRDMIDVQSFMWCIAPGTYA
ncbi:MAG TPA: hypothetical protein VFK96_04180 [Gammaproteobacteria bacterium]|nr:hypothetical protein [Gammaproteobacteria bacterium]